MEEKQSIITYKFLLSLIIISIGSLIAAASLELILIPNLMIDGGINGISIIFNRLCGGSLGLTVFIFNLPFIILGYNLIGKKFLIKTGYGMILFSVLLEVFDKLNPLIDDTLLATVYGGIALGIGVGLVIKEGGCLDGTETVAILVNRKGILSVGQVVFIFNIFIYGSAIFVFGPERALYSLLTYFISYKVIDFVSDGFNSAKAILIITDNDKEISKKILERLGRTVTVISGHGFISHGGKKVLYTVITRFEVSILKDILDECKSSSFATVMEVSEIIGTHVKQLPESM
ncbi:MAG: YitT family protein [Bacilli bacterium]|nr:YitT family protein [Bacilli bacterium]